MPQAREQLKPVRARHAEVEERYVGAVLVDHPLGRRAVSGLPDDDEPRVVLERAHDAGAEQRVVVGDDHGERRLPVAVSAGSG